LEDAKYQGGAFVLLSLCLVFLLICSAVDAMLSLAPFASEHEIWIWLLCWYSSTLLVATVDSNFVSKAKQNNLVGFQKVLLTLEYYMLF
jgi:hypothetical protein